MKALTFSVVIPALDEETGIAAAVASARAAGAAHVVVADGGSGDATVERARAAGATVVASPRGRARQMNAGARAARGDVLVFLHADTLLPPGAGRALARAYADGRTEATVFRLAFDRPSPLLAFYALATALPWGRIAFGDRALSVRQDVFRAVGGFPDLPAFEDLEMVRTLGRRGGLRFLRPAVTTSARRFARNGALRQQWLNLRLWTRYLLGTPPQKLAHRYGYGDERG